MQSHIASTLTATLYILHVPAGGLSTNLACLWILVRVAVKVGYISHKKSWYHWCELVNVCCDFSIKCRVAAKKRPLVHHHSADYNFTSFGVIERISVT